jgi:Fic family protein
VDELTEYEKEALLKKLRIKWIYNSNAIEGNTLSEGDTSFIIENGLTVQGKSLSEHNQVIGHMKALDIIYGLLNKEKIEEEELFLLHKAIQSKILIDYERNNQHHYYPHPDDTQHLMDLWFKEFGDISKAIQSKDEAVKIYTDMHISFAGIHPFYDGNGRLARLVANLPLLKHGHLPIIVHSENRAEYIELLSNYNLNTKELNDNTSDLIEESNAYLELIDFFKSQYNHSEELLKTLRESTRKMEKKRALRASKK